MQIDAPQKAKASAKQAADTSWILIFCAAHFFHSFIHSSFCEQFNLSTASPSLVRLSNGSCGESFGIKSDIPNVCTFFVTLFIPPKWLHSLIFELENFEKKLIFFRQRNEVEWALNEMNKRVHMRWESEEQNNQRRWKNKMLSTILCLRTMFYFAVNCAANPKLSRKIME